MCQSRASPCTLRCCLQVLVVIAFHTHALGITSSSVRLDREIRAERRNHPTTTSATCKINRGTPYEVSLRPAARFEGVNGKAEHSLVTRAACTTAKCLETSTCGANLLDPTRNLPPMNRKPVHDTLLHPSLESLTQSRVATAELLCNGGFFHIRRSTEKQRLCRHEQIQDFIKREPVDCHITSSFQSQSTER